VRSLCPCIESFSDQKFHESFLRSFALLDWLQSPDGKQAEVCFNEHPETRGLGEAASAACWRDEDHVTANRIAYQDRMAAAERILGNRMQRPKGGFFLWLEVGNGEEFALRAWREQGVRLLPGAYMGRDVLDGRAGGRSLTARVAGRSGVPEKTQSNPGFSYVRVALVNDLSTIMTALERVREIL
jgi:aspartate/methionine/tyrosine aminotransferase